MRPHAHSPSPLPPFTLCATQAKDRAEKRVKDVKDETSHIRDNQAEVMQILDDQMQHIDQLQTTVRFLNDTHENEVAEKDKAHKDLQAVCIVRNLTVVPSLTSLIARMRKIGTTGCCAGALYTKPSPSGTTITWRACICRRDHEQLLYQRNADTSPLRLSLPPFRLHGDDLLRV